MTDAQAIVEAVLAKQITEEVEVKGNLLRVSCKPWVHGGLILVFDDGRWACYDVCTNWDDAPETEFSTEPPDVHALQVAGLVEQVVYSEWEDRKCERRREENQKADYETYLELKKRFGDEKEMQDG